MEINRHNYEEFFLLYVDNELNEAERTAVEHFADQHPDLNEELQALKQACLSPDNLPVLINKDLLYKSETETSFITLTNFEEYLVLYIDNELNEKEEKEVKFFVSQHPSVQAELALLQKTKPEPETLIFAEKQILYRSEKPVRRIIALPWLRIAAAASVIVMLTALWIRTANNKSTQQQTAAVLKEQTANKENITDRQKEEPVTVKKAQQEQPVLKKKRAEEEIQENITRAVKPRKYEKNIDEDNISVKTPQHAENSITPSVVHANALPEPLSSKQTATFPVVNDNTKDVAVTGATSEKVKPVILDQAAFKGEKEVTVPGTAAKNEEGLTYLDTDNNTGKKSKGKFRGLLRKASRLMNHVTNPDIDEKQSIVRVASFEIVNKE